VEEIRLNFVEKDGVANVEMLVVVTDGVKFKLQGFTGIQLISISVLHWFSVNHAYRR